jgi:hypothetical protein
MIKTRRVEKYIVEQGRFLTYRATSGTYYEALDMAEWGENFRIVIYDPGDEYESRGLDFDTIEQLAGYMQILSGDLRSWKVVTPETIPNTT